LRSHIGYRQVLTSTQNGGHLQPLLYKHAAEIGVFELRNCATVAEYIKENQIECEFRPTSGCRTFWVQELYDEAAEEVHYLQEHSPEVGKYVIASSDPAASEAAKVKSKANGITVTQGAASLWPYKYVSWILTKLIKSGKLNLQTKTAVTKIEAVSPSSAQSTSALPPRYKVYTDRGAVTAHHLLLATNAYTSHLIPSLADIIVPVRETMTALVPPQSMKEVLPHSYGFEGLGVDPNPNSGEYLIQRPFEGSLNAKGHLMLGGGRIASATMPSVGEADDSVIDPSVVKYLQGALPRALILGTGNEARVDLEAEMAWTGIWAASRDGFPWVGNVPGYQNGLWLCAAYTGHGMPNATLCARAVVKMIVAEENGEDPEELKKQLLKKGDLPVEYFVDEARVKSASQLPDVATQDREGFVVGRVTNANQHHVRS
jgi:glycine/D-amino acid oxidase-like deaminating enzyme